MEKKLFALDQNFPEPIVKALNEYIPEAQLVPLRAIDRKLPTLDDWQVLLALHHDKNAWEGLVTTDSAMLRLPRELAVLVQTKLTLVVPERAGNDPLRATGLLLTHLPFVCRNTTSTAAQLWVLGATQKKHDDPWDHIRIEAKRRKTTPKELFEQHRLSDTDFTVNPLLERKS